MLAERMAICREVKEVKDQTAAGVIQPDRVREVLVTRAQWAEELDVEPEFAEQLFRLMLAETHRIEMAHSQDQAPTPHHTRPAPASALDIAACRIDHVAIALHDVDAATSFFVDGLGFRVIERTTDAEGGLDSVVVEAGGVTIVLTGGHRPDSKTAQWLSEHGPGVQHLAVEVLNAGYVRDALAADGVALLTDVVTGSNLLEQFFTLRDEASGLRLGFVSRTGDRAAFDGENIRALSEAMESADLT